MSFDLDSLSDIYTRPLFKNLQTTWDLNLACLCVTIHNYSIWRFPARHGATPAGNHPSIGFSMTSTIQESSDIVKIPQNHESYHFPIKTHLYGVNWSYIPWKSLMKYPIEFLLMRVVLPIFWGVPPLMSWKSPACAGPWKVAVSSGGSSLDTDWPWFSDQSFFV